MLKVISSEALNAWRAILGDAAVLSAEMAQDRYGASAIAEFRHISAALLISNRDQVIEALAVARRFSVPLYPVSTGQNWGYGSALPVCDHCVIVDLSSMNKVVNIDPDTGVAIIEPGVTQRGLRNYLDEHDLSFLVPVTGAGPTCSLLGNALERGYGITPDADHFRAVMAIEVVLADGTIYRTALSELGGEEIDRSFKWGIGPYLDGIFTQSNMGIVTQMTLALVPVPKSTETFFFQVGDDKKLEEAVLSVQKILRELNGVTGSINLMNRHRMLSMVELYPKSLVAAGQVMPDALVEKLAAKTQIPPWSGVGAIYGHPDIVKAAKKRIKAHLRGPTKRLFFFTPQKVRVLMGVARWIPGSIGDGLYRLLATLQKTLQLMAGSPSEVALPLAYWKSGVRPAGSIDMNPAKDGCGLLWYAPLVPMKPEKVRDYKEMVERLCRDHGIEPLITFTSLSDRCFDSTVPILFDRKNPEDTARAKACYKALLHAGLEKGFIPYRTNVASMPYFISEESSYWALVKSIKSTIDPGNIIAPGRYCPPL